MSMLNKQFLDCFDRFRMVEPIKEDGNKFVCRVYFREEKKLRMKERRPKENGREGSELVVYYSDQMTPWRYAGQVSIAKSLFSVSEKTESRPKYNDRFNRDSREDQLQRIGFKLM